MFLAVVFLLSSFSLLHALQCPSNCSMAYSMSEPFSSPPNCTSITSEHCSVKLVFWYAHRNYTVTFSDDLFRDQHPSGDDRQFIMIETAKRRFFSHDIYHQCREDDDCAVTFAREKILQMTKRSYNISKLYSDLGHVLRSRTALMQNLACFDMNDAVRQCTVPGMSGSCHIIDDLIKRKFHRRQCLPTSQESSSVNIYDSGGFSMMTIKCTRMLCNGPLTIAVVKKILYKHQITDIHGRIPGNSVQIQITRWSLLLTILFSFAMQWEMIK